ncbi:MAG: type II toxin-antitoxin system VapC family toxin [Parachlamydiaceae bacterium]
MNYLLDTCVVSDFFKKIPAVIEHFEAISPEQIHISSITVMEIEYGLKLNPDREKKIRPLWQALLTYIHVLPYSPKCATSSASIRADLKNIGMSIGPYDTLIAGSSLANHMIMVTSNTDEFKRIPEITLENWRN